MKHTALVIALLMGFASLAADNDIDKMNLRDVRDLAKSQQKRIVELEAENAALIQQVTRLGGKPATPPASQPAAPRLKAIAMLKVTQPEAAGKRPLVAAELLESKELQHTLDAQPVRKYRVVIRLRNIARRDLKELTATVTDGEHHPIQSETRGGKHVTKYTMERISPFNAGDEKVFEYIIHKKGEPLQAEKFLVTVRATVEP